jgi:SAM-dependent methyltransferase
MCDLAAMANADEVQPHSGAYFDAVRDYWWNLDHLDLIAQRLRLADVRSVLDVGAGVGHWGRTLAKVLSSDATVVGIDREPEWVSQATRLADRHGVTDRFSYQLGIAEELAFPDSSFDLVTCQTVLIHVPDPRAVLREMLRVTKPGGLVLLAEPNNFASHAIRSSVTAESSVEETIDHIRFALTCERGKVALGEGNISIGDLLPGYLAEAGAEQVQTCTSDKTSTLFPPYESEEQQALRTAELENAGLELWVWPKNQAKRYFLAGGGTAEQFETGWTERLNENHRIAAAITASTFHGAGGVVQYVIAGRRPRVPS